MPKFCVPKTSLCFLYHISKQPKTEHNKNHKKIKEKSQHEPITNYTFFIFYHKPHAEEIHFQNQQKDNIKTLNKINPSHPTQRRAISDASSRKKLKLK